MNWYEKYEQWASFTDLENDLKQSLEQLKISLIY